MASPSESSSDPGDAYTRYLAGMRAMLEGPRAATGQAPKEVIWTRNKARLYHYLPVTTERYPVPILMVYALINRPYVLDLMPGNSLVEYLVAQGFAVYLLDWGIPGDEDQGMTFDDYVLDYLPTAVRRMLRHAHAPAYTLFGYCMGGTMSAMYAALFPDPPLRNLVLLTTPIDFAPDKLGMHGAWTRAGVFDPDWLVEAFGNVPGELIDVANRMLKPIPNYLGTYVTLWDRIHAGKSLDTWLAMNKWVNDGIPFPGAAFRQWIRELYQQNKLVKGGLHLRGRRVDLANITCAALNIAGTRDHICAPAQAEGTLALTGSADAELVLLDAGHVGLLTGAAAKRQLWPQLRRWLGPRSR